MASTGLQVLGMAMSIIGWVGCIISCALPMWRVTAFIGNNIVVAQIIWEGLWMNCIVQSTGQMQCKVYDSMLALPQDLQAARALTVICILVALLAILIGIVGAKCTNCIEDENTKAKVSMISGIVFVVSGILMLIPVCWSANSIIRDFYNPLVVEAFCAALAPRRTTLPTRPDTLPLHPHHEVTTPARTMSEGITGWLGQFYSLFIYSMGHIYPFLHQMCLD
uniref:Claudin n=1 Tax=Xenopus tropicalis TaxID=8364 RepID=A0A803J262_XENTR